MKNMPPLYLIILTIVVIAMAWITGQLDTRPIQIIIAALAFLSGISLIISKRISKRNSAPEPRKKTVLDFGYREQKSGLTWGGGNIKASEAKRGTKRKFLGK